MGGRPGHNLSASPRQILMMMIRRCGSIGRNTKGGTAGAAGTAATGGGAAAGGGVRTAARAAGAGFFGAGGLLIVGVTGADATGAAGADAAGAGGATGVATAAGGAAAGEMALTAAWQPPESLAKLRFRHSKASLPPGCTPEQFAMKSERQFARMALACADVGCCACAEAIASISASDVTSVARPTAPPARIRCFAKLVILSNAIIAPSVASMRRRECNGRNVSASRRVAAAKRVFSHRPI